MFTLQVYSVVSMWKVSDIVSAVALNSKSMSWCSQPAMFSQMLAEMLTL